MAADQVIAKEDPRHILDVLVAQNEQLRHCLREVEASTCEEAAAKSRVRTPLVEVSSAGLSASQEQDLRLLLAKFAEGVEGAFDAKIFSDGEQYFHLQQDDLSSNEPWARPKSHGEDPKQSTHGNEASYRWFVEPDGAALARKMKVAAGMVDNLFRTQCHRCIGTTDMHSPPTTTSAASLPSLMRQASISRSTSPRRRRPAHHHRCKPNSAATVTHLQSLGVYKAPRVPTLALSSPLRDEARRVASFPWISIRLLYNLAQIHLLDVSLQAFRQALKRFSRLLEVSRSGEEARLRAKRRR